MLQNDALHWKSEARRLVLGAIQALPPVNSDILVQKQGRGVHVTGVSAAYTFKLNKNILSE
jgi:hypothetical protein